MLRVERITTSRSILYSQQSRVPELHTALVHSTINDGVLQSLVWLVATVTRTHKCWTEDYSVDTTLPVECHEPILQQNLSAEDIMTRYVASVNTAVSQIATTFPTIINRGSESTCSHRSVNTDEINFCRSVINGRFVKNTKKILKLKAILLVLFT